MTFCQNSLKVLIGWKNRVSMDETGFSSCFNFQLYIWAMTWEFQQCATSKCSDQPAHTSSLIRAFASPLNIELLLKTYAAISNAHLSRVCKQGKLSGSCLSTLNGFGSIQLPIFLCHIGVPTFSSQNKVIKVCSKYLLTSFQNWSSQH